MKKWCGTDPLSTFNQKQYEAALAKMRLVPLPGSMSCQLMKVIGISFSSFHINLPKGLMPTCLFTLIYLLFLALWWCKKVATYNSGILTWMWGSVQGTTPHQWWQHAFSHWFFGTKCSTTPPMPTGHFTLIFSFLALWQCNKNHHTKFQNPHMDAFIFGFVAMQKSCIPESTPGSAQSTTPHQWFQHAFSHWFIYLLLASWKCKKIATNNPESSHGCKGLCKVQHHIDNANMPFPIDFFCFWLHGDATEISTHNSGILTWMQGSLQDTTPHWWGKHAFSHWLTSYFWPCGDAKKLHSGIHTWVGTRYKTTPMTPTCLLPLIIFIFGFVALWQCKKVPHTLQIPHMDVRVPTRCNTTPIMPTCLFPLI